MTYGNVSTMFESNDEPYVVHLRITHACQKRTMGTGTMYITCDLVSALKGAQQAAYGTYLFPAAVTGAVPSLITTVDPVCRCVVQVSVDYLGEPWQRALALARLEGTVQVT